MVTLTEIKIAQIQDKRPTLLEMAKMARIRHYGPDPTVGEVYGQMAQEDKNFCAFCVQQATNHNIVALEFCHEYVAMTKEEQKVTKFLYQQAWAGKGSRLQMN